MGEKIERDREILSANLPATVTVGSRFTPEYIDEQWSVYKPLAEEEVAKEPLPAKLLDLKGPPPTIPTPLPDLPLDATADDYAAELDIALPLLSTDQLKYIEARARLNSDAEVGREWGMKHASNIYQWKSSREPKVLKKVLMWLQKEDTRGAAEVLRRHLMKAANVKVEGLESVDERLRQAAATEILDRALGKPMQRLAQKTQSEILTVVVDF
jgi:hypothetical protein